MPISNAQQPWRTTPKNIKVFVTGTVMSGCSTLTRFLMSRIVPGFGPQTTYGVEGGWLAHHDSLQFVVRRKLSRVSTYDISSQTQLDSEIREEAAFVKEVDGILIVVDSQPSRNDANQSAIEAFRTSLARLRLDAEAVPVVFALNKRDLSPLQTEASMRATLAMGDCLHIPTIASTGIGVLHALTVLAQLVLRRRGSTGDG